MILRIRYIMFALVCLLLVGCYGDTSITQENNVEFSVEEVSMPAEEKQPTYRFGIGYSSTGYTEAFTTWRNIVYEKTNGDVELVLFGENVLGEGLDMVKAVQAGTLSISASSTSVQTPVVPETSVMDVLGYFVENTHYRFYTEEFFDELNKCYQRQGLELLHLGTGPSWIIASQKPIQDLHALQGFRVRTSGGPNHDRIYEALGMEIVNSRLDSIPYMLDEGSVDGMATTGSILRTLGLTPQMPYALDLGMFMMSSAIVMNYDAFHSMPESYQQIVRSTIQQLLVQDGTKYINRELQVRSLTAQDRERLREIAEPLVNEILAIIDKPLINALQSESARQK